MSSQVSFSSPASSIIDVSWETPSKDALGSVENAAGQVSQQNISKQDGISETVEVETKCKADYLISNSDATPPKSHTTSNMDATPTCDPAFSFSDTNTGNRLFNVHQFKLSEFDRLRPKLEQATTGDERKTIKLEDSDDDFHNLLIVLYSSVYDFHLFSTATLRSTLKLATKYAHPTLRTFAIKELEKHELEPIDRFALSRDCDVAEWMPKAMDDLCWREEPITIAEARILGPEKFVEVAARREGLKFERGSRVSIAGGLSSQTVEAKVYPEIAPPSRPISQDLGGILAASSNLLTTTSETMPAVSKDAPTPALDTISVIPSPCETPSENPSEPQSTTSAPVFSGFNVKPPSFNFGAEAPEAKAPGPLRQIKALRTNRKSHGY
ncbi:unnamed protein product [Rhizoctonia solani]|uniref:BTB domain-containing protein n=1 Tax=Rhizoctonia solani TaxID=456999 RepID=A0A8H2WA81_9AGAM|nr:unnamed protein product [Rhizoctonia solani]